MEKVIIVYLYHNEGFRLLYDGVNRDHITRPILLTSNYDGFLIFKIP
jgi:hypothetical protein